jgi:hypothetical protein
MFDNGKIIIIYRSLALFVTAIGRTLNYYIDSELLSQPRLMGYVDRGQALKLIISKPYQATFESPSCGTRLVAPVNLKGC